MSSIRCFLAVRPDIETARLIADLQRKLRRDCERALVKVSWVPPPNMHHTIRFLGQIPESMGFALKSMLEPVTAKLETFELVSRGVGAFPENGAPRVVWVGSEAGSDDLERLYRAVNERLGGAGFAPDDKPFRAHLTIGRIKEGPAEALADCLAEHSQTAIGKSIIQSLSCFRSVLTPKGAEYHALWQLPLSSPRRQNRGRETDRAARLPEEGPSETPATPENAN